MMILSHRTDRAGHGSSGAKNRPFRASINGSLRTGMETDAQVVNGVGESRSLAEARV
jgi:hypothetical protein